jgi:4-amino-4-deoxy-L-arabinose transferase-like glycosyltransferase
VKINSLPKYLQYIAAALVLAVVVYVRIRLLKVPLERDEGEFAYIGQLLLKGISPFSHVYTMKLPGVGFAYALFMVLFGQSPAGIHTGLLIVNGISAYLLYLLTKRCFDHNVALLSCTVYALLSLSTSVNGLFAHATHFVVLFILAGFLLLLYFIENRRLLFPFTSGVCFGLAITMKQHAVLLVVFAVVYVAWRLWRNPVFEKKLCATGSFLFLLGTGFPYALIVLWMVMTGNFAQFWFWTVMYAREYVSGPRLAVGWEHFSASFEMIAKYQLPLWLLAGFGFAFLWSKRGRGTDRLFLSGFVLFSFLSTCPGLIFRGHYFVLFLPAVAIMAGVGINSAGRFLSPTGPAKLVLIIPVLILVMATFYSLYRERDYFFTYTPVEASRALYGANPFPEALQIAEYLRAHTTPDDQIAVLGSEPEIYFYADRFSATGYIYMYGLMENQPLAKHMQEQLIREVEMGCPQYIVVVNIDASWLTTKSSNRTVFDWEERYVRDKYSVVGVIDIIDPNTTRYLWDDQAVKYTPVTETFVTVFKRKSEV